MESLGKLQRENSPFYLEVTDPNKDKVSPQAKPLLRLNCTVFHHPKPPYSYSHVLPLCPCFPYKDTHILLSSTQQHTTWVTCFVSVYPPLCLRRQWRASPPRVAEDYYLVETARTLAPPERVMCQIDEIKQMSLSGKLCTWVAGVWDNILCFALHPPNFNLHVFLLSLIM